MKRKLWSKTNASWMTHWHWVPEKYTQCPHVYQLRIRHTKLYVMQLLNFKMCFPKAARDYFRNIVRFLHMYIFRDGTGAFKMLIWRSYKMNIGLLYLVVWEIEIWIDIFLILSCGWHSVVESIFPVCWWGSLKIFQ